MFVWGACVELGGRRSWPSSVRCPNRSEALETPKNLIKSTKIIKKIGNSTLRVSCERQYRPTDWRIKKYWWNWNECVVCRDRDTTRHQRKYDLNWFWYFYGCSLAYNIPKSICLWHGFVSSCYVIECFHFIAHFHLYVLMSVTMAVCIRIVIIRNYILWLRLKHPE